MDDIPDSRLIAAARKKWPEARDIRLACFECDRSDFDGIKRLPENWEGIIEDRDEEGASVVHWWTHIGDCPECLRAERKEPPQCLT